MTPRGTECAEITEVLIGTRSGRFGPRPSGENEAALKALVAGCLGRGEPVPILVNWGGAKCYGHRPAQGADLFDLLAVERLVGLNDDVRRLHEPGVEVTIVFEDWTERHCSGKPGHVYANSLARMCKAAGGDHINLVLESALVGPEVLARSMINCGAILSGDQERVGWRGEIDWPFYLQRARSEYPGEGEPYLRVKVAQYLGIALARYQCRVFPEGRVRLSFCPYPRATPDAMRRLRVEWKVKASANSNKTTPPWAGYGCVSRGSNCHTHLPLNLFRACEPALTEGRLSRHGIEVPFFWVD